VLPIVVPNEAPPVNYETIISFDKETVRKSFRITAPVEAELALPNAEKEVLATLTNRTAGSLQVATKLTPHAAWKISTETALTVTLAAHETRRLKIPPAHRI
jgi:hypothetical protein